MKKMELTALVFASAFALAACGGGDTKKAGESAKASEEIVTEEASSAAETEAEAETEEETLAGGGQLVKPLQKDYTPGAEMPDGAYLVKLDAGSLKTEGKKRTVSAEFFNFDRYAPEKVEALKEAEVIRVLGKDVEVQGFELRQEGDNSFKVAKINGGAEEGGVTLIKDGDYYRTQSAEGTPLYYSLGTAVLPLSGDAVYLDFSDLDQPSGETWEADRLGEALAAQKDEEWGPRAASVVIKNGEIVQIFRTHTGN